MPGNELSVLTSEFIDPERFWHGFPERRGGVSQGAMSSLNLGTGRGDSAENVTENRRRLARWAGYDPERLVVTQHVHGTSLWVVSEPRPEPAEFDGLVSKTPGVVLGALAADCVPMIFADPKTGICGVAHAGWRGSVHGIGRQVVERMVGLGAQSENIRVALGPSIAVCCFEVGPEVVEAFQCKLGALPGLIVKGPKKEHIDLRRAHRHILEGAGVRAEHIDDKPPCTRCHKERFFSYRRDGQGTGSHMGFIGLRP